MKNGIWTKTPQHQRVIDFCYKHRRFLNTVVWKDKQNLGGGEGGIYMGLVRRIVFVSGSSFQCLTFHTLKVSHGVQF